VLSGSTGGGSPHSLEMSVGYAALATGGEVMGPAVVSKVIAKDGKVRVHAQDAPEAPWTPENVSSCGKRLPAW